MTHLSIPEKVEAVAPHHYLLAGQLWLRWIIRVRPRNKMI
jgi:hypothetical protein